jgi:hypothetical protein
MPEQGVEIITAVDSTGRGVYVSCAADTTPADMVAGLCDLLAQVTAAALATPEAQRAGDLPLENFAVADLTDDDGTDDLVS